MAKNNNLKDFLRDFEIKHIAPLIKQASIFYEAIKKYELANNLHLWNENFESYIIGKVGA